MSTGDREGLTDAHGLRGRLAGKSEEAKVMCRSTVSGTAAVAALLLSAVLGASSAAVAQTSPDPYKPWNSAYESYVYPMYPRGSGISPNQAALMMPSGTRGANQFQSFLDELEGIDREPGRAYTPRRGIGVPYTQAYRRDDRTYGRVYTPNEEVDKNYNAARQARDEKYAEYLNARDGKDRARLLKEYDLYNRRTLRELMGGGRNARPAPAASSEVPGLPPLSTRPRGARLPSLSVPEPGPTTGRSGRSSLPGLGTGSTRGSTLPRGSSTGRGARSPSDTLRRSETMDRARRPSSRALSPTPPGVEP
jgi:hypothetical protein